MWGSVGTHVQACINLRVLACLRPTTLLVLRHDREPFHNKYSTTRGEFTGSRTAFIRLWCTDDKLVEPFACYCVCVLPGIRAACLRQFRDSEQRLTEGYAVSRSVLVSCSLSEAWNLVA